MKTYVMAVATAVAILGSASPAQADHYGKVPWVKDVEQGMQKARRTGLPMMLFFTADW